jgi:hypothetical protein
MFALMPAFGATAAGQAAVGAGGAAAPSAFFEIAILVATVMVKLLLLVAVSFAVARLMLPQVLQLLVRYASAEAGHARAAWCIMTRLL